MSSCLIVQHVAPEPATGIIDALEDAGVVVEVLRVFAGASIPTEVSDFDGVVVMGGPMSASSDDGFPTRKAEISLLSDALRTGIPTLGICLGAQLLAAAGGAKVKRGEAGLEIGWGPVRLTGSATDDNLLGGLAEEMTVLHWHGDTFDIPPDAVHLAASPLYRNQAFRLGTRAWGLQFHLEVDLSAVEAFLEAFGDEVELAGTTSEKIRDETPDAVARLRPRRDQVLTRFAAMVVSYADEVLVEVT